MLHTEPSAMRSMPTGRRDFLIGLRSRLRAGGTRTMIVGEAGIGKSSVLDVLVTENAGDRVVLRTQPRQANPEPFAGVRELLASAQWTGARGTGSEACSSASATRSELPAALRTALCRFSATGSLIVVDGWQWLDPESHAVLGQALQDRAFRDSVSLLATRRLDGSADDLTVHPLFAPEDVFALGPLPLQTVIEIIRDCAGGRVADHEARAIAEQSQGNPLLALELVAGADADDPRRTTPTSFSAAIRDRVRGLDPEVHLLLATLAVMGRVRSADVGILCERAQKAIPRGLELNVIRQVEDELVVADPLMASIAVTMFSTDEKRRMHAVLAEAALPERDRAEHRDEATAPGVDEHLASLLERQAERARTAGHPEASLRLMQRSLKRTATSGDRYWARVIDAAEDAYTQANSPLVLDLLRKVDLDRLSLGLLDRAVPLLALALKRQGGDTAVRQRMSVLEARMMDPKAKAIVELQLRSTHQHPRASDWKTEVEQAAGLLTACETPQSWRYAQQLLMRQQLDQGRGLDETRLTLLSAPVSGVVLLRDSADTWVALEAPQPDELSRSRGALLGLLRSARAEGEPFLTVQALSRLFIVDHLAGQTQRAEPHLHEAEAHARRLIDVPASLLEARGLAAMRRGDRDLVRAVADDACAPNFPRGDVLGHGLLGLDAAASGEWDRAHDHLTQARRSADQRGVVDPGRRLWIDVALARAFLHQGDLDSAAHIAAHLEHIAAIGNRRHALGQARRVRVLILAAQHHDDEAVTLLHQAVHDLDRGGFRPELAGARIDFAEVLRRAGREPEADQQLRLVRHEAEGVQDPRLNARLDDAAQTSRPTRRIMTLTPSEERVARGAASGQSNRQIASDLFLSVRTVETHLASAYRKLGLRSRTQLALELLEVPGADDSTMLSSHEAR